jgi:hypothetical protein
VGAHLSDKARGVAGAAQAVGDRRLGAREEGVKTHEIPRPMRGDGARIGCVPSREQREARRRAEGRRGVGALEGESVARQRIQVGREAMPRAVRAEHVPRDVIRHQEDEVGANHVSV